MVSARVLKAPLARTRDALLSSPSSSHFVLPSGASFIVRPPPSPLPPTLAHASRSPFLTRSSTEHLLPVSHPHTPTPTTLSPDQIQQLQSLRRENAAYWTRSRLAQKFLVGPAVVARLGWGEGAEGRQAEKRRAAEVRQERESREAKWGWRKAISRDERRRRRALW